MCYFRCTAHLAVLPHLYSYKIIIMKHKVILLLLAMFLGAFAFAQQQPKRIILDTDIGPDYDDVGAMAILHALADKGEAVSWPQ